MIWRDSLERMDKAQLVEMLVSMGQAYSEIENELSLVRGAQAITQRSAIWKHITGFINHHRKLPHIIVCTSITEAMSVASQIDLAFAWKTLVCANPVAIEECLERLRDGHVKLLVMTSVSFGGIDWHMDFPVALSCTTLLTSEEIECFMLRIKRKSRKDPRVPFFLVSEPEPFATQVTKHAD